MNPNSGPTHPRSYTLPVRAPHPWTMALVRHLCGSWAPFTRPPNSHSEAKQPYDSELPNSQNRNHNQPEDTAYAPQTWTNSLHSLDPERLPQVTPAPEFTLKSPCSAPCLISVCLTCTGFAPRSCAPGPMGHTASPPRRPAQRSEPRGAPPRGSAHPNALSAAEQQANLTRQGHPAGCGHGFCQGPCRWDRRGQPVSGAGSP